MESPEWFELYQAKKEYTLADLSPKSIDNLFSRLIADNELFNLYYK